MNLFQLTQNSVNPFHSLPLPPAKSCFPGVYIFFFYHTIKLLPHFIHTSLLFPPEFLPQFQCWLNCFPAQKVGNLQEYIPVLFSEICVFYFVLNFCDFSVLSLSRTIRHSSPNKTVLK